MDEKFLVHFVGIDRALLDLLPFLPQSGQRGFSYAVRKVLYREVGFEILRRFQLAKTYEVVEWDDPENPLVIIDGRKARLVLTYRYTPEQMWHDINHHTITRFYFILTPPFFKRKFEAIAKDGDLSIYRLFLPDRRYSPATEDESIINEAIKGDDSVGFNFTSMIINGDFHYHDNSTNFHGSGNTNCGNTYNHSNNCGNFNPNNTPGSNSNPGQAKGGTDKISRLKRALWKGIGIVSEVIFRQICCTMLKGILNA